MRNLKKVLSLVLCVAMMLSVMVMSTGATSFTDEDEFSDNYAEAAEVLTGMGVINGYEDGSFQPKDNITRAEVAAMIYRVATGDVDSGHPGMTAGANYFTDVSEDDWYAGYVNYCADAGYIKGFEDNTFRADENVTGYQVLAMILRAVGYDKNNEYTGVNWTLNVASTAMDLKLLKNVDSSVSLTAEATRELVAEFIFQAIRPGTYTVDYVPAVGDYRPDTRPASSLGEQVFDLDSDDDADAWGRPATVWYADNDKANGQYDKDDETVYATIEEEALAVYTTAVVQCDVADETGVSGNDIPAVVNGQETTVDINENATKATIGEQGRLTEVYEDCVVMIDTFLAQVTDVVGSETDGNGHQAREALLQLRVYNGVNNQAGQLVYLTADSDWTYTRGDMLLVNAVTTSANASTVATTSEKPLGYSNRYDVADYLDIVADAESFVGAQTYNTWNANTHTIDGTVYNDALFYVRDDAGIDRTENFNWWMDQYGNVIGSTAIDRTGYAVLKDLIWIDGKPGYAEATLINMDGTEYTATVTSIDGDDDYVANTVTGFDWDAIDREPTLADSFSGNPFTVAGDALVSSNSNYNETYEGYALYLVFTNDDGTVELIGSTTAGETDTVINYVAKGTLSANASTILAENGTALAHIDDSTQIIVNNGDGTYSAFTRSTLPNLAGASMEIFYSVVDGAFTQNVYIKRGVDQATDGDHLFTTDSSHLGQPTGETADDQRVWEIPAVVDGVSTTIRTIDTDIVAALTAEGNQGKLFDVTFDMDALDVDGAVNETYGFVTQVDLVTEETDVTNCNCDYLYPYNEIHLGNGTIECDNVSYNVSSATTIVELDGTSVAYNVETLEEALKNAELAVWVVESDDDATNVADTVYIGTKLAAGTAMTAPYITMGDDTYTGVLGDNNTYTITIPYENRNNAYRLTAETASDYATLLTTTSGGTGDWTNNNGHNKTDASGSQFDDSKIVWANQTGAQTFNVSVKAEDDHDTTAYTISVVVESERQWTADERAEALLNKTFDVSVSINGPDSVKDAIIHALRDYLNAPYAEFEFDLSNYNIEGTGTTNQISNLAVTCIANEASADTVINVILNYTNA